ncbi:hypothetical protein MBLNU230_g2557t1 [Neophaeotheca triangularis]
MWLLSCDGSLFGGKTKWLPPDSQHIIGRTTGKNDNGTREPRVHWIENKTVSRKHVLIKVGAVKQDANPLLHRAKTDIEIQDNSKTCTFINGEKIKGTTLKLTESVNTIRLGTYDTTFKIRWQPVNLSISGVGKRNKKMEKLNDYRQRLAHTDIKVTAEFVSQKTTHMISPKRNTPGCLQALVEGRWIVVEGFVDALATVTAKDGGNVDGVGASKLELDFESNWPAETEYPIPSSNEPVQRPAELLRPDQARQGVFHDLVFVFLTQQRYDDLRFVVESGEGKATIHEMQATGESVESIASKIKDIAGQKGPGQINLSQYPGPGGIVVVESGDAEFDRKLAIALHQRLIAANEFLDAILTLNTNPLHELLQYGPDSVPPTHQSERPPSAPQSQMEELRPTITQNMTASSNRDSAPPSAQEDQAARPLASVPRKRRIITQSRFKDVDDYDPSDFKKAPSESPEPPPAEEKEAAGEAMDVDEPTREAETQQNSLKRPASAQEALDAAETTLEPYLTGAHALKRRRLEAAQRGDADKWEKQAKPSPPPSESSKVTKALPKKKDQDIDVMKALAARRAKEEREREKDEELEAEFKKGLDISKIKDVVKVEEMRLPERQRPARTVEHDPHSERWDPKWNGRKNFKKFRPQGQRADAPRLQRVIVTLEEVPRKGHGIGEKYWLPASTSNLNHSKSQRKSQPQASQAVRQQELAPTSDDTGDAARFRRRLQVSYEEDAADPQNDEVMPEANAGTPRDLAQAEAASQTLRKETQRASVKRPAAQQDGPAAKKARQSKAAPAREAVDIDEDDGDELKFRRRRRG